MRTNRCLWVSMSIVAIAAVSGCSSSPKAPTEARINEEVTVRATVLAVDGATRKLKLQRADGSQVEVVAGPTVRNFDQIKVGDTVSGRYLASIAARRLDAGEPGTKPTVEVAAVRAEPGERPAGGVGAGVAVTVTVKSVDLERSTVVFTDPEDGLHAIEARRNEGRSFVAGLKPGDRVELRYDQALIFVVD